MNDQSGGIGGNLCCVVIDIGYSATYAIPCIKGRAIQSAVRRLNIGGKMMTTLLQEILSYRQYNMMDEVVSFVSLHISLSSPSLSHSLTHTYTHTSAMFACSLTFFLSLSLSLSLCLPVYLFSHLLSPYGIADCLGERCERAVMLRRKARDGGRDQEIRWNHHPCFKVRLQRVCIAYLPPRGRQRACT